MAKRYPGASWQPLGRPSDESAMRSHDLICVHTMVGTLPGTDDFFEDDGFGGTESHFGTGGDGACIQWQDLAFSADANLDGWHRVISIENADMGPGFPAWSGSNVPRFTEPQADRLEDLIAWLCSKEAHADCPTGWKCHQVGIPPVFVPDSKPGRRGICVHRQGIDGNFPDVPLLRGRVSGGERWSSAGGKACPGDRRILQTANEIVPAVRARLNQEDDMQLTDEFAKDKTVRDLYRRLDRFMTRSAKREARANTLLLQLRPLVKDAATLKEIDALLDEREADDGA